MKLNKYLILISTLLLAVSCESKTDAEAEQAGVKITIGTVCGWCAGNDSLVITEKRMTYIQKPVCDGSEYKTSKSTSESSWNKIISLYDQDEFAKVDINTCHVCADGCDTWIRVENGTFTHKIRFGGLRDSDELKPIEEFIKLLVDEKSKFAVQ